MRTLSVIAALGLTVAPCGGANPDDVVATVTSATSHSVATADTTTTTLSPSTPGAPNMPLLADRSTLTVADAGRSYTTTLGNRIEHQLSSDYLWSGPRIEGPAQLIEINFVADPSFMAWEVLIEGTGTVTINAVGECAANEYDPGSIEYQVIVEVGEE